DWNARRKTMPSSRRFDLEEFIPVGVVGYCWKRQGGTAEPAEFFVGARFCSDTDNGASPNFSYSLIAERVRQNEQPRLGHVDLTRAAIGKDIANQQPIVIEEV